MPKKILAVDDERHIVRLVQVNLERAGYEVVTAFDGKDALEKVEAERPDLVVLADASDTALAGALVAAKLGIAVEAMPAASDAPTTNGRLIAQLAAAYTQAA